MRERLATLGNLAKEFNFNQPPAPPFILPTHPAPWAIPTAFRLRLNGMPSHETPRLHGGGVLARAACTTTCRLHVGGYITIAGRKLGLAARTVTATGSRHLQIAPNANGRRLLMRLLTGRQAATAHLIFTAVRDGPSAQATSGTARIKLLA